MSTAALHRHRQHETAHHQQYQWVAVRRADCIDIENADKRKDGQRNQRRDRNRDRFEDPPYCTQHDHARSPSDIVAESEYGKQQTGCECGDEPDRDNRVLHEQTCERGDGRMKS